MKIKIRYPLFSLLFLCSLLLLHISISVAQPFKNGSKASFPTETSSSENTFDITNANKLLNILKENTDAEKQSSKELQSNIVTLTKLQEGSKKCVDTNTVLLNTLNQRLAEITTTISTLKQPKDAALTEEQKYLDAKKEELSSQLSECRLFLLRAEEIHLSLARELRDVVKTQLLYAQPNIFQTLKSIEVGIHKSWNTFDFDLFAEKSGLAFFANKNIPLLLLPLCVILVTFYSYNRLKKKIIPLIENIKQVASTQRFKITLIAILRRYFPIFSGSLFLAIFFSVFTHSLITPSYIALISYAFLIYLFYVACVRFYFYPPLPAEGFTTLPKPIARSITRHLKQCGFLVFIAYAFVTAIGPQAIERPLIDLFHIVLVTLFTLHLIAIAVSTKRLPTPHFRQLVFLFCIRFFLILFSIFVLATEYLGYHLLAFYLLFGVVMTAVVTFFTSLCSTLISATFDTLQGIDQPWQKKLRTYFGLRSTERLIEITWLRILSYVVLYLGFSVAILKIWVLAQANFQTLLNYLSSGFDVGKLHIAPPRIIVGALFFTLLSLITRWFRTYIIKNANWQLEGGARESLASIIGYLGFAIAFILGALIAGVNFSGVALIASALAIGIGFGMQNIVSNFVSGIILLIERPIKLGDRIMIGTTEGVVKKISLRSTHITTGELADLIVPNSELIAQKVVNYMLYSVYSKIIIKIGIAYGSDTDLAKNILLSLAKTHPGVITHRKDMEPNVQLKAFGESSLQFELTCVVQHADARGQIMSDLHFEIDKAFREKGIEIACPRQDIKIMQLPKNLYTPPLSS